MRRYVAQLIAEAAEQRSAERATEAWQGVARDASGARDPAIEGEGRPLLPAWAVDEVVEHWPGECECEHVLGETERVAVGQPFAKRCRDRGFCR